MKSRKIFGMAPALLVALVPPPDRRRRPAPEAPPAAIAGKVVDGDGRGGRRRPRHDPGAQAPDDERRRRHVSIRRHPARQLRPRSRQPALRQAPFSASPPGQRPRPVTLTLDIGLHEEQVTVAANLEVRTLDELAQPIDILNKEDLDEKLQPTIGETLANEPGVNSTFFGRGASRPDHPGPWAATGSGCSRTASASATSRPRAPTTPSRSTRSRPTRSRSCAARRRFSTARAPSAASSTPPTRASPRTCRRACSRGRWTSASGRSPTKRGAPSRLDARAGNFVMHGDASKLTSGDYDIPGFARTPVEPGDPDGFVPNSAVETEGAAGGISYVGRRRLLGVSYSGFNSVYGSPAEEEVQIDLAQRRIDVAGQLHDALRVPARARSCASARTTISTTRSRAARRGRPSPTRAGRAGSSCRTSRSGPSRAPSACRSPTATSRRSARNGSSRPRRPTAQGVFLFEEVPLGTAVRVQGGFRWEHSKRGLAGVSRRSRAAPSTATRGRSASSGAWRRDGRWPPRVRARRRRRRPRSSSPTGRTSARTPSRSATRS